MHLFYRIILWNQQEEMRFLAVLCLLSAAVALPTPEQLHTNLPALPPPSELKLDEKDKSAEEVAHDIPLQQQIEEAPAPQAPNESEEKPKVEKEEDKEIPDEGIMDIQQESSDSKEDKDSKEKSKDSKESKEPWEQRPEEPKEEKREKDSKESKEKDDEDVPVVIEIISKPKGVLSDFFSKWFPNINVPWPFNQWRNADLQEQPIYIVSESDLDLD